jgi:Protein of unknown function (DUF1622)
MRSDKMRIGRSLPLGLEVLVAPDIAKTMALELAITSFGPFGWTGFGPHPSELDAGARK